jgi:diacylglycerol kinase family enzyme
MAAGMRRIPVFLNASAGLRPTDVGRLRQQLGSERVDVQTVDPAAIRQQVSAAAAAGEPIIGVAGGDGTLRTAAAALVGTRAALLCVPTGTLNNFARRLGIDSIAAAAAALRRPRTIEIAVGSLGSDGDDAIFLNTVTFGEYSRIVRMRERYRPYFGKWPAAVIAFVITLLTLRRITFGLRDGGVTLTRRTPFVWAGVGWGSFPLVHEATERRSRPDLEIAVLRSPGAAAALGFVLRLGLRMLTQRGPKDDDRLEKLNTRQLTVSASRVIDATADGEVLRLNPPIVLSIRDGALHVVTAAELH